MQTHRWTLISITVLLAACASQPSQPDSPKPVSTEPTALSNGALIYGYRCKGCHEPNTPGAPSRRRLGRLDADEIVDALATGNMKIMSQGMTRIEMREVAAFLTNTALPAEGDLPAVKP